MVGARGARCEPDIQLCGLGIQPQHCEITIEDGGLFLKPFPSARSCVNGSHILERTMLHNGDRIVWGNHHFFRVNCPKAVCEYFQKCTTEQKYLNRELNRKCFVAVFTLVHFRFVHCKKSI